MPIENNKAASRTHKQTLTAEEMQHVSGGSILVIGAIIAGGLAAAAAVVGLVGFAAVASRHYRFRHWC